MTRDEILNMPAGIDMDISVVTRVMGYLRLQYPAKPCLQKPTPDGVMMLYDCPRFSTDISAAWEVVEKNQLSLIQLDNSWFCGQYDLNQEYFDTEDGIIDGHFSRRTNKFCVAPTAPLAICRAGLLASLEAK